MNRNIVRAFASAALICSPVALPAEQVPVTWVGETGNWNVPGNWDPAVVPNNNADTYLVRIDNDAGTESFASLNQLATLDGVEIDAGDTLQINNFQTLTLATDSLINNGTLRLNHTGASSFTRLQFTVPVTLQGSGEWIFSNSTLNRIGPLGGLTTLNPLATIRGAGGIELGVHPFANQGVVRQEGTASLTIFNGAGGFSNPGLLEATGSGGLILQGGLFTNTGGEISALDGSFVQAGPSMRIVGGILETSGSGEIRANGTGVSAPLLENVTLDGSYIQQNLQGTELLGTVTNEGLWTINHTLASGFTTLVLGPDSTLTGSGELVMGTNANAVLAMQTGSFTHGADHTIRGTGQIQADGGAFINKGLVRHTGGSSLTITTGEDPFSNEATIESVAASGTSIMLLRNGSFENTATAVIRATGTGLVQLGPAANFSGGTLATADDGELLINSSSNTTGESLPILRDLTSTAVIAQPNVQSAIIRGSITNNGLWTTNHTSATSTTNIYAQQGMILQGSGTIHMSGNQNGRFVVDDSIVTHESEHTIRGGGQLLVSNGGSLVNKGLVRQEGSTNLTVSTGTGNIVNEATMESAGAGRMILTNALVGNQGGLIRASDTGVVQLGPSMAINEGVLAGVDGGSFDISSSNNTTGAALPVLQDVVINGPVTQANVQSAIIRGSITNNGLWTTNHTSASSTTNVYAQQGMTLQGTGTIHMSGNQNGRFVVDDSTVTHESGHTIRGGGQVIVSNGGSLVNKGVIRQEGSTNLTVSTGTGNIVNEATMESAGAGRMILTNAAIQNDGAVIRATGTGVVQLGPTAAINEGVLAGMNGGSFDISSSNNTTGAALPVLQDVVINGPVTQANVQSAVIRGTVSNNGQWTMNHTSAGSTTNIVFQQGAILTGDGEVFMSGSTSDRIISDGTTAVHESGHTIRGTGQIMAGTGGFINRGTVQAEGTSLTLSANVDGFLNEGNLVAPAASSLIIANGANFRNEGSTLVETGGSLTVTTGNYLQMDGETQVDGTMTLTQVGASANIDGGILSGTGIITRSVNNNGFVAPGTSAGLLTINQLYNQSAAGTLVTELGGLVAGTQHDRLVVVGAATIDGRLHVELIDDFVPTVGNEFTILTGLSVTGEFDALSGALEADGVVLEAVYEANQVKLVAVALDGLAVNDVHVTEGAFGTTDAVFTVSLTPANESETVQVTVQTEDGTATVADNDYIPLGPTTLTFAPGETEKQVTVKVINDGKAEPEEYFKLVLSDPSNATVARAEGIAIIAESPEIPREDWMIVY